MQSSAAESKGCEESAAECFRREGTGLLGFGPQGRGIPRKPGFGAFERRVVDWR